VKKEIVLVGGGGHCKACIDVIETQGEYDIAGIVDIKERIGESVLGYRIIATDDDFQSLVREYEYFLICIGQIKLLQKRMEKFKILKSHGAKFPIIISPLAYISKHAKLNKGTVVMHNVTVNAYAKIGRNCILNTASVIEHDAIIKDNCHISTGAIINGGSIIEENCFVGSNVTTREGIHIGRDSVIGAGLTILRDMPEKTFLKNMEIG